MQKLTRVFLFIQIMLLLSISTSHGGTKKIRPDQLTVYDSIMSWRITPEFACSATSSHSYFQAVVKLPVGKVVKELTLHHYGAAISSSANVGLHRVKIGEEDDNLAFVTVSGEGLLSNTDFSIEYAKIKRGYTYYVIAYSANYNSRIRGIEIKYK